MAELEAEVAAQQAADLYKKFVTARALLRMPLPPPIQTLANTNFVKERLSSRASRLRPTSVKLWSLYDDKPIDTCIKEHQDLADNTARR